MDLTVKQIAKMIDHSLLQPNMTRRDIDKGCDIAVKYETKTVCVRGYDVAYSLKRLKGSDVEISVVTGFPHGNSTIKSKIYEIEEALGNGAIEIDTVIPIGLFLSGEYDYVKKEIGEILQVCNKYNALLKVIFENHYLTSEQIVKCCQICDDLDVHFVKTSTGYAPSGANVEDLKIMRKYCKDNIQIKAAGGIRNLDQFLEYYNIGVSRQGTRSTVAIIEDAIKRGYNRG